MKHFLISVGMFCSILVTAMENYQEPVEKVMQGYYPYRRPITSAAKGQPALVYEEGNEKVALRQKNQEKMNTRMLNIKWFTEQRLKEKVSQFKVFYNQRCDFIVVCQKVGCLVLFAQKWLKENKCTFSFVTEDTEDKGWPANFTLEQCMLTSIKKAVHEFETVLNE